MAKFNEIKLTNSGLDMLAQAQTGKVLTFTAVRVGDGYTGSVDIRTLTALVSPVEADISIAENKMIGTGQTRLTARLRSGNAAFYLREIGIYAKVAGGTEALYAYASAGDNADYIPAAGGATNVIQDLNLFTVIGNAQNVSAVITAEVGVGREEFETAVDALTITGAARTIVKDELPANMVLVSNENGAVKTCGITLEEILALDMIKGNIQEQFNAINASISSINKKVNSIGNAYLGDEISEINFACYKRINNGHSENLYYEIVPYSGVVLKDGTRTNFTKIFTIGDGVYPTDTAFFGFNPKSIVVKPINEVVLDNTLTAETTIDDSYVKIDLSTLDFEEEETTEYAYSAVAFGTLTNN